MPKKSYALLVLIGFFLMWGCSSIQQIPNGDLRVQNLSDLIEHQERAKDLLKDMDLGQTVIVMAKAGQRLPVVIEMDMPMMKLESKEQTLVFTRDMYFRLSKTGLLISADGQDWAKFGDNENIKRLFGMTKGELSIGLSATEEKPTHLSVAIRAR